jgi:hypothetical protein
VDDRSLQAIFDGRRDATHLAGEAHCAILGGQADVMPQPFFVGISGTRIASTANSWRRPGVAHIVWSKLKTMRAQRLRFTPCFTA